MKRAMNRMILDMLAQQLCQGRSDIILIYFNFFKYKYFDSYWFQLHGDNVVHKNIIRKCMLFPHYIRLQGFLVGSTRMLLREGYLARVHRGAPFLKFMEK